MPEARFPVPKKKPAEFVGGIVIACVVALLWQAMASEAPDKPVSWFDALRFGILTYMAYSLGRHNGWADASEKLEKVIEQLELALEEAQADHHRPPTKFNLPL